VTEREPPTRPKVEVVSRTLLEQMLCRVLNTAATVSHLHDPRMTPIQRPFVVKPLTISQRPRPASQRVKVKNRTTCNLALRRQFHPDAAVLTTTPEGFEEPFPVSHDVPRQHQAVGVAVLVRVRPREVD
jgi:hypothetical protein